MSGAPKDINPGQPPLLWSSIEKAFRSINQNFNDIYATIQSDGSTEVVNFERLFSDVSPGITEAYSLGSSTHRWDKLHVGEWTDTIAGYENNGVWIGTAQIKGISGTIDLPANSTVNGDLIFDPEKRYFRYINLDDGDTVEADHTNDTLSFYSGNGMQFIAGSDADSITFENTGVLSNIAGAGISVSSATGNITISNTGVLGITNGGTIPVGLPIGSGLSTSAATGSITLTNTGVLDVDAGFGITISRDDATGIVTVTNSAPAQVAFRTFYVSGTNIVTDSIIADSTSDILTLEEGYGITLTTTPTTDTLKIEVNQDIDIYGSIFAQDSSLMLDSEEQKIYANGGFFGDLEGDVTAGRVDADLILADTIGGDLTGSVFGDDSVLMINASEHTIFASGGFTGDLTGSVFADDSTLMVDAVDNVLYANRVETNAVWTTFITEPNNGPLQIAKGTVDHTGNVIFINPYGSDTYLIGHAENIILRTGPYTPAGLSGTYPSMEFTTAGAFETQNGAYFKGDLNGSVNADDSTVLIDGTEGKIVGPVETASVVVGGTAQFNITNVPSDSTGSSGDLAGMVAFDATSVYYCIADWAAPGSADIWVKQDWSTTGAW